MTRVESKIEGCPTPGLESGELQEETTGNRSKKKISTFFEQYVQPCLAEMLGTTLFVFVGCSSVIGNEAGVIQPAVAHGLALAVVIQMLGNISGGHFNPAVSLSVYLCGGMELLLLLPYVLAQMIGAMIGAGLAKGIYPSVQYSASRGGAFNVVETSTALGGAMLAEVTMAQFLTMMVCMLAVNSQTRSQMAAFCIGLTVTACILAGASVSGACMNPARAFGPAVVANYWNHHWIYWVGPTCGALLTVVFIRLLFGDEKTRLVLK